MAEKQYKTWLKKADEAAKKGRGSLYERVLWLSKVYDDKQFKQEMKANGKEPAVSLNDKVADTFTNFIELYTMHQMFPDRCDWIAGDLPAMRAKMLAKINEKNGPKKAAEPKQADRRTVTLAEHDRMKHEYEQRVLLLEQENRLLKEQLADLREMLRARQKAA